MDVIVSVNPATLEENGRAPVMGRGAVDDAVAAARAAQPAWAAKSLEERSRVLRAFQRLVLAEKREIAALVTKETGKPVGEALAADVLPALESAKWLLAHGAKVLAPERFHNHIVIAKNRRSRIVYHPLGVVGIIGAWNYPFGIATSQSLFALFAGNAVVFKPSEHTTLTGLLLGDLLRRAGVPPDVFRVVTGPGNPTGMALATSKLDHAIFTGSVATGRSVLKECQSAGIEACLELGGSDPALVLEDADVEVAANGILWGRFTNAGQTCAAVKRVFVHERVADAFTASLVAKVKQLRVGNGTERGVDVGPLITESAVRQMEELVADATKRGARLAAGGARFAGAKGHFFEPTVLVDVPPDARVLHEEVFGPVLPIVRVADEEEAVRRANETQFGLSASVWSRDVKRAERVAERIVAGTVTVNDCVYTYALVETPWMGVKASGRGATHGETGLLELVRAQHVNVTPNLRPVDQIWWFPYGDEDVDTWSRALDFLYGGLGDKAREALPVAGRLARKKNL